MVGTSENAAERCGEVTAVASGRSGVNARAVRSVSNTEYLERLREM